MPSLSESVRIVAADRVRLAPLKSKDMASKSRDAENVIMCAVLRDIFGNPFRPITLNAAWVTPNVNALAQTIYDDRAFERLPELTNALEHAKCDNEKILDHCRELGPHVRGCWVVDLVLGKR